ncbi:MAG: hypothetical protein H7145_21990 [Akkermansiaceae bacterium]|nr:hypothetical protein [Armatimonadota bacterium]
MRLLPQDLGTKWHILTVRNRSLGIASVWTKPTVPRLGRMGKRWIKDLPVSEEVAANTLPLTKEKTSNVALGFGAGFGWIFPAVAIAVGGDLLSAGNIGGFFGVEAITLGLGSAYVYSTFIGLPRQHLKKLHATALTEEELTPFLTGNVPGLPQVFGEMAGKFLRFFKGQTPGDDVSNVEDELERSFLFLVRDVIRSQTVPKESEDELRAALTAIGEALCRLPPVAEVSATGGSLLAADQRAEAQMLYARAERESDPVIAGSLRRQANALEVAARASENTVAVSRRVRALRQELRAQIDVLRLTLPTWGRVGQSAAQPFVANSEITLSNIAGSVQSVASEAVAMSEAHDELDEYLGSSRYETPSVSESQTIRAR